MSAGPVKTPAELLAKPLQFLKGIGPARGELLARLGLKSVRDALFFFPRDYQDLSDLRPIAEFEEDHLLSVRGVVDDFELRETGVGRSLLGVLVRQGQHYLRALWFNQPYMREKFRRGQEVLLSGKAVLRGGRWEMVHPRVQFLDAAEEPQLPKLLPIYPLTEGLNQSQLRHAVQAALDTALDSLDEVFPAAYLEAHDLWPVREAIAQIHFPKDRANLDRARRRLIYQELLVLQLALALRRSEQEQTPAPALEATAKINARIRRLFPFDLTPGQEQAIAEVSADMARTRPMNRLLQGDVGSGKTVVALYAMLLAVAHGSQAALMAPTEVLARQHALTLGKLLEESHVKWALLTGGLPAKQRTDILDQLKRGEIHVVIGTQAIVAGGVQFAKLGVVVVDEQHKFGVRQRADLRQTGVAPHYLVMTATPIPRTVAMTQFGDLEISTIPDSPPGRQAVHTYLASEEQRARWWEFFRKKLREGRQGFVIVPVIDAAASDPADNENIARGAIEFDPDGVVVDEANAGAAIGESGGAQLKASLEQVYEELANGPLEAFRLGLLHGRLNSAAKEAAMQAFRAGQTQVLVATSVVEVGVDVPNANLMTIEGGHWFGLAQLHQLRGRIGRGAHPGYCCVFADPQTDESRQRLAAFAQSTDGFRLAEIDFELRGPGDLLGTRQHGLPPLRIADLAADAAVLAEARRDARQLVEQDTGLQQPEHAKLKRMVVARYGRVLELGDVG